MTSALASSSSTRPAASWASTDSVPRGEAGEGAAASTWRAKASREAVPVRLPIGYATSEFQKRSNSLASSATTGPLDNTSMSMKLASPPRSKYASAMLRPPVMAKLPSAMNSLLCIRWLMRENWCSESTMRCSKPPPRTGSGLNMRTSMWSWAARPANSASWPVAYRSSTSTRTRTPRAAAACSSRRNSRPLASSAIT